MLNIYTGRENIDKNRFMFEAIKPRGEAVLPDPVYILVPDQFTLETERSAFDYMGVKAFVNPIVLSFTRLADRVLSELGGGAENFIDKYGKYMLISSLLYEDKDEYEVLKNMEDSSAYIEKISNVIMSLKSHLVSPEDLKDYAENLEEESLLRLKLADIQRVYDRYESTVSAARPDAMDYLKAFSDKIPLSNLIAEGEFYISGFDYFSPLHIEIIKSLGKSAKGVNVLLTAEKGNSFFALTNNIAEELTAEFPSVDCHAPLAMTKQPSLRAGRSNPAATTQQPSLRAERGNPAVISQISEISETYSLVRPPEIAHIEKAMFSFPLRPFEGEHTGSLRFARARDFYSEAEAAASAICRLVREEGLRYKDIILLTNDMEVRGEIIRRTFENYGLPTFMDRRRDIDHNPVLEYILALPELLAGGLRQEDVIRWVKTGLVPIDMGAICELENYAIKYKLRGSAWGNPLRRRDGEYDDETFEAIEAAAKLISGQLSELRKLFGGRKTARDRADGLEEFLTEVASLPERIEEYADELESAGYFEYESEMRAVWGVVLGILDQIRNMTGRGGPPEKARLMSIDEFATILNVGFQSIKIGVLPSKADSIVLGTMQRTRVSDVKALFVLGANDGELPKFSGTDGLITDVEMEVLSESGLNIGRSDATLLMEEQLAIYKNLSKPTKLLYVSYSSSDEEGAALRPAQIVGRLKKMFPDIEEESIGAAENAPDEYLWTPKSVLPHLVHALRETASAPKLGKTAICVEKQPFFDANRRFPELEGVLPEKWADVLAWFSENDPISLLPIRKALGFENRKEKLDENLLMEILPTDGEALRTSPSAVEKYTRCSFAYFMDRGLRLRERRVHEIDARNMGELYHKVLENFGKAMDEEGRPAADENSKWNTMEKEAVHSLVSELFSEAVAKQDDGLFTEQKPSEYRTARLESISKDVAWALTERMRNSATEKIFYETEFDRKGELPSIDIEAGGKKVRIAGRIDRLDVLSGDYAKIMDFKSGATKFSKPDVEAGWQLQLMIYLKAAAEKYKPGGVSYFNITEEKIDLNKEFPDEIPPKEVIEEALLKKYQSNGFAIKGLGEKVKGEAEYDQEQFSELQKKVDDILVEAASGMASGVVEAKPLTVRNSKGNKSHSGCDYCEYVAICNYIV
ncbi:MAG: PD-(D/E)XK nuclease family protein [Clostridiales Family XIII bacterium]|jgi:ATP-dependent helicase/nuclease subunit B|nr:PD-(D/E)XK nuclease family protein [Clostridiales Family XIII bacterium]